MRTNFMWLACSLSFFLFVTFSKQVWAEEPAQEFGIDANTFLQDEIDQDELLKKLRDHFKETMESLEDQPIDQWAVDGVTDRLLDSPGELSDSFEEFWSSLTPYERVYVLQVAYEELSVWKDDLRRSKRRDWFIGGGITLSGAGAIALSVHITQSVTGMGAISGAFIGVGLVITGVTLVGTGSGYLLMRRGSRKDVQEDIDSLRKEIERRVESLLLQIETETLLESTGSPQ